MPIFGTIFSAAVMIWLYRRLDPGTKRNWILYPVLGLAVLGLALTISRILSETLSRFIPDKTGLLAAFFGIVLIFALIERLEQRTMRRLCKYADNNYTREFYGKFALARFVVVITTSAMAVVILAVTSQPAESIVDDERHIDIVLVSCFGKMEGVRFNSVGPVNTAPGVVRRCTHHYVESLTDEDLQLIIDAAESIEKIKTGAKP